MWLKKQKTHKVLTKRPFFWTQPHQKEVLIVPPDTLFSMNKNVEKVCEAKFFLSRVYIKSLLSPHKRFSVSHSVDVCLIIFTRNLLFSFSSQGTILAPNISNISYIILQKKQKKTNKKKSIQGRTQNKTKFINKKAKSTTQQHSP